MINDRPFSVRENLFRALMFFRSIKLYMPLWVDAICINQNDVQERNQQVSMTGTIYRLANRVRVWLGTNTADNAELFEIIPRIESGCSLQELEQLKLAHLLQQRANFQRQSRSISGVGDLALSELKGSFTAPDETSSVELMHAYTSKWDVVARFLERSYWTRIWIVQEYLLASEIIICSDHGTMAGQCLENAIDRMRNVMTFDAMSDRLYPDNNNNDITEDFGDNAAPTFQGIFSRINDSVGIKIIDMRNSKGKRYFDQVLEATQESKSQDPHDKIYALLALADDFLDITMKDAGFGKFIEIDYDKPVWKVKRDIAWFVLQRPEFNASYVNRMNLLLERILPDAGTVAAQRARIPPPHRQD